MEKRQEMTNGPLGTENMHGSETGKDAVVDGRKQENTWGMDSGMLNVNGGGIDGGKNGTDGSGIGGIRTGSIGMEIGVFREKIIRQLRKVIVEQDELIELSIIGLLSGGHVLLEGVPGLAKTLLVKALSETMSLDFKRIQFTPDLMPADITGTRVFNMQTREFELKKGPVFTNLLLADEINRTPPKTQAGLLEAMGEATVTIDGEIMKLPEPYMVFATENPLEYEGTYPLPEALVDRFLMKIIVNYPSLTAEKEVVKMYNEGFSANELKDCGIQPVWNAGDILRYRDMVRHVRVDDALMDYIVLIVSETRKNPLIDIGSSPRGSIALLQCSKACAACSGRDFVIPEDIKKMAVPVLRHRITLKPELEIEGVRPEQVLSDILAKVKVPR